MKKTTSRILAGISATVVVGALGVSGVAIANAAGSAAAQAASDKAMLLAEPAYAGAGDYSANLDLLALTSTRAKAAFDAEQERLAAERAAAEAQAAALAAQEAENARQAAERAQAPREAQGDDESDAPESSGPIKCPAGTHANAVDENGNESACEQDGPNGEHCQAYDENNNCTVWLKE